MVMRFCNEKMERGGFEIKRKGAEEGKMPIEGLWNEVWLEGVLALGKMITGEG